MKPGRLLGRALGAAALAIGVLATTGGVASAATADGRRMVLYVVAQSCDAATGEWIATWSARNDADRDATLSNVTSVPAGVSLPQRVSARATVTSGTVRIPNNYTRLTVDVTWDDGVVDHVDQPHTWQPLPPGIFLPFPPLAPVCEVGGIRW
jgi:hypothetical protein